MATINIGADNAGDQFYRYKMPAIQAKIEGRGNGIKTNVVNMVDVAKALARPPTHTLKYFGCELGAQTKFDSKSGGQCIVNGAHTAETLANHLEGYIKRFVQCHSCGNPETVINISKRETIHLKCKACGAVSDVDMRHKLCTFIIKNPPEKDKAASKKDKQLRRAEKEREDETWSFAADCRKVEKQREKDDMLSYHVEKRNEMKELHAKQLRQMKLEHDRKKAADSSPTRKAAASSPRRRTASVVGLPAVPAALHEEVEDQSPSPSRPTRTSAPRGQAASLATARGVAELAAAQAALAR